MSDAASASDSAPKSVRVTPPDASQIFFQFLEIGASSFGGGIVAYLRNGLVSKRHWVDDKEFLELLSIRKTLPGLNATNMAILVGDKLRGWLGSVAAICGFCLPGCLLMPLSGG